LIALQTGDALPIGGLSAVVASLIALVVSISINSIRDDDSILYRAFVTGVGVGTLVPASLAIFTGILQIETGGLGGDVLYYTGTAAIFAFILTMGVIITEGRRGLDNQEEEFKMMLIFGAIALGIGAIVTIFAG
jgi:hypothetical protein